MTRPNFKVGETVEVIESNNPYCPTGTMVIIERIEKIDKKGGDESDNWHIYIRKFGESDCFIFSRNGCLSVGEKEKVVLT